MADILTEAQRVLDEAQEAIAWIAFWKNGQSWNAVAFWPEVDEGVPHWDDTEVNLLNDILKQDPNAIVVNAYYTALRYRLPARLFRLQQTSAASVLPRQAAPKAPNTRSASFP